VEDIVLRERLGSFYEESEASFDSGAWLSFALMCGAVYEGLLYARFKKNISFNKLIVMAKSEAIIDSEIVEIMHTARSLRNLVHAGNYSSVYVSRLQAMDMRKVMGRLIKTAW
jgi:hypothetical protein